MFDANRLFVGTPVAYAALLPPTQWGNADDQLISADGAEWIFQAVQQHLPNVTVCLDPFHVVAWAGKALGEVRRRLWNQLRAAGDKAAAKLVEDARFAV